MDFNYTEDQLAIKDVIDRMFSDLCDDTQVRNCYETEKPFHSDLWEQLVQSGMLLAPISAEYGGSELGMTELSLVLEAQGRSVAPVPILETVVECALPIAQFGSEEFKQSILPAVAEGKKILTAVRPYEGLRGLDPLVATADGDGITLNGNSSMTGYASLADGFLVNATKDGNPVVAYVDAGANGITVTGQTSLGGEAAGHVLFENVSVDAASVIASGDKAAEMIEWQSQRVYAAMAAQQVGILREGLRRAAEYTNERKQFGRPLSAFQAVAQQAADAYMVIEALQGVTWRALEDIDKGNNAGLSSRVAKFWVCEAGHIAAHIYLHVHGGIGQDLDYPLHRYFSWAKKNENYLGSATRHTVALGGLIKEDPAAVA